jgi:hypothetical protein
LKKTETNENWYSRAKAEADKGIPRNERVFGVFIVLVGILVMLYFIVHQIESTGFFTSKFGALETIMLYGNLIAWTITGTLEGILAKRLLSRLFDVFGGIIFITLSTAWLLVVFPFDFVYFADVLPEFLRFLVQWISNDIARGVLIIGVILMIVAAVYSPIAYKVVNLKRFRNQQNNS